MQRSSCVGVDQKGGLQAFDRVCEGREKLALILTKDTAILPEHRNFNTTLSHRMILEITRSRAPRSA